jgi:hypothetical protein
MSLALRRNHGLRKENAMTSLVVGALVLMAGLFIAILVTRSAGANSNAEKEDTSRSARASGFRFFLAWFFVGGILGLATFTMFLMAAMGGVSTPPGIWMIFWSLGLVALPFLLALGGLPAAIQMSNGKEWRKTALMSLAVCITSWVVIAGVVFLGPSILGWSW